MRNYVPAFLLLLGGCASAPSIAENERELVLQHVAVDAGTSGPFRKQSKRELEILSDKDRLEASTLLDHGASAFVVFPKSGAINPATTSSSKAGTRVIVVQHGRVVGDFAAR